MKTKHTYTFRNNRSVLTLGQGILKACENSLKRLQTDYLDMYLLHWLGRYPFEETVEAMLQLQKEGKIRDWGVSNMDVTEMEEFYSIPKAASTKHVEENFKSLSIELTGEDLQ